MLDEYPEQQHSVCGAIALASAALLASQTAVCLGIKLAAGHCDHDPKFLAATLAATRIVGHLLSFAAAAPRQRRGSVPRHSHFVGRCTVVPPAWPVSWAGSTQLSGQTKTNLHIAFCCPR